VAAMSAVRGAGRRCDLLALPTAQTYGPVCLRPPGPLPGPAHSPEGPPSVDELRLPVGLLNVAVQLADLLRQVVRLLLQARHLQRRDPLDLADAVAVRLLAAAGDGGSDQGVLLHQPVAARDGGRPRASVRKLRAQGRYVDLGRQGL